MSSLHVWQVVVALGVPGIIVLVFYLLMVRFKFVIGEIAPVYGFVLAVLFMLVTAGVILFGLWTFKPNGGGHSPPVIPVKHNGPLSQLSAHLREDGGGVTLRLPATPYPADDFYVDCLREKSAEELITEICQSNSGIACLKCERTGSDFVISAKYQIEIRKVNGRTVGLCKAPDFPFESEYERIADSEADGC